MICYFFFLLLFAYRSSGDHPDDGVVLPSRCETCKVVVAELEMRLLETGKSLDTTYAGRGKTKKYRDSDLRLLETLENLCERVIEYSVHKEYKDSRRFAKRQSNTMKTLRGLVEKGVQVDLGIPYELWDWPSVEVTRMKMDCEGMIENHESAIEEWYHKHQDVPLIKYLCEQRVLLPNEQSCLNDPIDHNAEGKDEL
ncbi:hypothetical protein M514_03908, partial [Trichuris suis]